MDQLNTLFAVCWLVAESGLVYLGYSQPDLTAVVALTAKVFLSITYSMQLLARDREARVDSTVSPWILLSYHR